MATFELDNAGNTEAQQKLAQSYLLPQSSLGIARTGVIAGLGVSQTPTPSGSVLVAAGCGVVQASVLDGASVLVNDTQMTLDVFTDDPMGGLPRNDVVAFDSLTATVIAIIGTPNATPNDPAIPATALPLWRLRHLASATTIPAASIEDMRLVLRRPYAEFAAEATTTTGGAWSVTWPAGLFTVAPIITVATRGAYPCVATATAVTTSGCTGVSAYLDPGGTWPSVAGFTVYVRAVQMTAATAAG